MIGLSDNKQYKFRKKQTIVSAEIIRLLLFHKFHCSTSVIAYNLHNK